ncbi:hypothetical protein JAAARDRAFT_336879 [Jaapia argillacea MUCL 33604]|uniref:Uncharacterized protein n=1 Tax=Jaapia argillacea MUCL 33604 TaxID=933084 RepID=A0A067PW21_9AGAM|nr:hypothetical protein JAAARDRAFT_336879 [Jaapia argillacea MUCL 33604]
MDCILGIDFGNSIAKVGSTTLEPTGTLNIHSLSVRITPSTPTYICFEPQTRVFGASAQALQRWNISTTVGSLKQALAKSSAPLAGDPDLSLIGTVSSDVSC